VTKTSIEWTQRTWNPTTGCWFVSLEPLLGPINLREAAAHDDFFTDVLDTPDPSRRVSWVIVGGESGPGARPMDLTWVRSILAQCREAGVAPFVKQLGARPVIDAVDPAVGLSAVMAEQRRIDREWPLGTMFGNPTGDASLNGRVACLRDPKGGDPSEWPGDLRIREMPEVSR
jgi:hypothetical protein